ncbi:MAG TPA: lamin tail domain-containing protein [Nanoarchaeota archaeon]|nr:MAG: Very large, secreted (Periplasmic) protein [archaeon GW2011_AR6]HIH17247.1 lamin tail domain-containing protein [Nanoarchaeota archaeon]HIH34293.1 lamin tail domain-containing protein [Nanoarchaeota archaeon]HIH50849.1 lamin tail domain-containing protein [Nanoarchaeota archaeon]
MEKKIIPLVLFIALFPLIFSTFQASLASAEIRINEFEQNPLGDDKGNEWVELYSSTQVDLGGWRLVNGDNGSFPLNGTIDGYLVITFSSLWLDNSDEKVILFDGSNNSVDDTPLLSDSRNDAFAWNLCESEWKFLNSSKGGENRCDNSSGGGGGGGGNTSGNSTGGTGGSGGNSGKKNKNETIRVRSNLSTGSTEEAPTFAGNPKITFLEKPSSLNFGQVASVKANFLADADYPNLIFFFYTEPKRVVRDFSGEQVTKASRGASTAISVRAYSGEEIGFSLPLNIVENCNKYYPEGEYEISLAGFYLSGQEWKSFATVPNFPLSLSFNDELCLGTGQDLQVKANGKQAQQAQTAGASTQLLLRGKIIKSIGLWLLIALTAVALFIIWKKKLM